MWDLVLGETLEIGFGYRTFKWRNNASANAAVMCVIVGIRNKSSKPRWLFDQGTKTRADNINSYLIDAEDVPVTREKRSLFGLPEMSFGNMPYE